MALRFLGIDPDTGTNGSPTIWQDDDGSFVIQGWRVSEADMAEIGEILSHETVLRIPARMLQFFPVLRVESTESA